MEQETYTVRCSNGYTTEITAKSDQAAKRKATLVLKYGAGDVSLIDNTGNTVAYRRFWQCLNRYGWDRWIKP